MGNNKYKVLVVEDDHSIANFVQTILEANGYQVLLAERCHQGVLMLASHVPDLVVLDLGLPDADGTDFIRIIRSESMVPIIVLSARTDEQDKVSSLDLGANDYITKPFSAGEFLARVRSVLRFGLHRAQEGRLSGGKFQLDDLTIEYDSRRVFVGQTEIKLTQTEYNILAYLSQYRGKVMTYSAIIRSIWGTMDNGSVKKLQVNMANIRKKLGCTPGDNRYVVNELGVGYRMLDQHD